MLKMKPKWKWGGVDAEREYEHLLLRNDVERIVHFRVRGTYDFAQFIRKLLGVGVPLRKQ